MQVAKTSDWCNRMQSSCPSRLRGVREIHCDALHAHACETQALERVRNSHFPLLGSSSILKIMIQVVWNEIRFLSCRIHSGGHLVLKSSIMRTRGSEEQLDTLNTTPHKSMSSVFKVLHLAP